MNIEIIKEPDFRDAFISVALPKQYGYTPGYVFANRLDLLSSLVVRGSDHSKAARGIWVTLVIEAPRYFWSEFDTYKVGVQVLSSTSTMHKLTSRELVSSDFESGVVLSVVLAELNKIIKSSLLNSVKLVSMKRLLPEGFLQTRIVQINYQALRNIYFQRKNHRLKEWGIFCDMVEELEHSRELITIKY